MNEKRLVEELSFNEYLRRNPMPTKSVDNENYHIEYKYEYKRIDENDWQKKQPL